MTSVYNLLREACGISQAAAAELHGVRLDTVKSWCSDRRPAPIGVINELKQFARDLQQAGLAYAERCKKLVAGDVVMIGIPHDDDDARSCGFPSLEAYMRVVAIAIQAMPDHWQVSLVPRVRGAPALVLPKPNTPQRSPAKKPEDRWSEDPAAGEPQR